MTRRHKFWTAVAAGHLVLIACSAAGFVPSPDRPVEKAVRWYGAMSGATNRYGFFKEVGSGCKVTFTLTDKDGRSWQDVLSRGGNREAEMRANGSIYLILDFDDALATSWAASMLARHPLAHQVVVQFEQYEPPSMAEYRDGVRPEWKTTYVKVFVRKKDIGE
jgi:hypothetical protein